MSTERALGGEDGGHVVDLTVDATADEINALGGTGIPVCCDAKDDDAVAALLARVDEEQQGTLDLVVCSAFTTPPSLNDAAFRDDFWKQGAAMWDACHQVGLRAAYMACCGAAPLMIRHKANAASAAPLIVLISSFGGKSYTFNVAYGVGKAALDRLASDMSVQLSRQHGVSTVALYPGLVRTEGNLELERRGEWAAASGGLDLSAEGGGSESPALSGKAVVALAALPPGELAARSGSVQVVAELAKEFGFTEEDGTTPPSIRSLKFLLPNFVFPQIERDTGRPVPSWVKANIPDFLLPWSTFSSGPPPSPDSGSEP